MQKREKNVHHNMKYYFIQSVLYLGEPRSFHLGFACLLVRPVPNSTRFFQWRKFSALPNKYLFLGLCSLHGDKNCTNWRGSYTSLDQKILTNLVTEILEVQFFHFLNFIGTKTGTQSGWYPKWMVPKHKVEHFRQCRICPTLIFCSCSEQV